MPQIFVCDEEVSHDKVLCLFHDEDFLNYNIAENERRVLSRLTEKVNDSIDKDEHLFCIGYILPNIIIDKNFKKPVYFNYCRFRSVDFSNTTFLQVSFVEATFSAEANFSSTRFSSRANFRKATFSAEANFFQSLFKTDVDFSEVTFSAEANFGVLLTSKSHLRVEFSAEANFSKTRFLSKANFTFAYFKKAKNKVANFFNAEFHNEANFFGAEFNNTTNFVSTKFKEEADFTRAKFFDISNFSRSLFVNKAFFSGEFKNIAYFQYVTFENPDAIIFEIIDMSNVSFISTNITKVRFNDQINWGGDDGFQIIEEEWFKVSLETTGQPKVTLKGVLSVYRNLRENYEFRRRYDDAGKFFIKEMELKRKYRHVAKISRIKRGFNFLYNKIKRNNSPNTKVEYITRKNGLIRRNISLIGFYYNVSRYGEDLIRPTIFGILIIIISTLFFVTQSDPNLLPTLPISFFSYQESKPDLKYTISPSTFNSTNRTLLLVNSTEATYSKFIGFDKASDPHQWEQSLERSLIAFIPLLPTGNDIKTGLIDYAIKIVGGAITFGFIIIALRRKFERKYYH
jgi:uncharacterized protein YjbI with pentapeptide repeats